MRAILSDVQAQQEMQQFEVELIGLTQQAKNLRVIFIEQESLESFTIDQINLQENILEFPLTFHQLKGHFPGQTRFVWEVYLQWQVADHFETVQIENEYIETKQIDLTTFQKISGDFSGFTNIELTEKNQDAVFELHNVQRLSDRIRLVGAPKIGDQVMKNIVITVGNTDNQNNSFRLTNNISTYSDLFVFELLLTDLKVNQKYILKIAYDFEGSHIHQQVGLISEFDLSKDFATDANGQTVFLEKSYDNVISLTRLEKSSKFSTITQSLVNKTQRLLSASGVLATKLKLLWIKRLFKRSRSPFVKPTIVFESFGGRQVSDSPLAIYRVFKEFYPSYNLVWTIYPELKAFCREHGIRYVVRNSAKWVNLMRRAQCWVSNARYPSWVKKSKFTFYLQTWHGTPLKKLGLDIKQVTMPGTDTASYHRNFTREANRWDALISPNDYSTNIFRSAFGYKNQVLKLGYPRNDELLQATPEQITQLKQSMGIPANKKVVLYAPTYRDNSYISTGKYTFKLPFSLKDFQERYGKETILILRMHYLIANQIDTLEFKDCVLNLSDYPNISDLYLVSDLLVTDYSSVFFDFAYLKRPILFYPYDYEMYKNELRGFYLDYEHELPGKIVHNETDLFSEMNEALKNPDMTNNRRFQEFYKRFCAINSGDTSRKVVNYIVNAIRK